MQSLAQLRARAALLTGTIALAIALSASWMFRSKGTTVNMHVSEILASAESLTLYLVLLLLFQVVLPVLVMMSVAFAVPVRRLHAARVGLAACAVAIVIYVSYVVTYIRLFYG